MSPSDSEASGSEAVAVAWPRHPLATEADASLLAALDKGEAAAIWTLSDAAPIWWNEAGAALFELPSSRKAPAVLAAAVARACITERPWLERWRMAIGRRPVVATLLMGRARLQDGRDALIVSATAVAPPILLNGRAEPPSSDDAPAMAPESPPGDAQAKPPTAEVAPRGAPARLSSGDARPAAPDTVAQASSRRLTWQTDAEGRLLAGPPGTSLSQALGRGAPMQPALLSELFAKGGPDVDEAIAAGRPVSAVPIETIAAPDGSSLVGIVFGAPVLDRGREIAGYRGFLVVSELRAPQPQLAVGEARAGAERDPPEDYSKDTIEGGNGSPVRGEPASLGEEPVRPVASEAAAPPRNEAREERPQEKLAEKAAPDVPIVTATSGAEEGVGLSHSHDLVGDAQALESPAATSSAEAPPRSNVIALRKPGADVPRLREQDAPALSPAERDAFADIAKALGAAWTKKDERPDDNVPGSSGDAKEASSAESPAAAMKREGEAPPAAGQGDTSASVETAAHKQGFAEASSPDLVTIIDRLPVGILVQKAGVAVAANRTLLDLLGHESFEGFQARGGINELFAEPNLKSGAGKRVAIRTRDGEVIEVDARCQAIKWQGEAATLLSLRRSLQGETQSLEASHRTEISAKQIEIEEMRALLDRAADGIVTIDELGRVLAMNASAEKLFGYRAGEIAGEALAVLISPECHQALAATLEKAWAQPKNSAAIERCEITGREREGGRIPLSMGVHAGRAVAGRSVGSSRSWHVVFRDLTASKDSEAGLVEARVAAERTTAQKSEFLAKVSHEIRTPLNSIVGFADIIAEERFGPLQNERYREYVKDIRASGTHIISLVNDLLDLSKIESGRMELSLTPVNLNAEVAAGVALVQTDAARSRVLLRQSLAQGLPAIIADARSVKQIVLNILSNAVKFTEPGGQVIVSTALTEKGEVIFRARDTGIGMSERELAEALEPFKQFATTLRPGGSGLGLSLTKALVKANQANLSIASRAQEGTLVEVIFPRTRVLAA
ncbi:MAG: PAS domain S-box protein [Hyphomicrobiales bacterium]|nr:PAS domain S-box protein [Hyphomicrobiales bacterium]